MRLRRQLPQLLLVLSAGLLVLAPSITRPVNAAPFTFVSASADGPWRTAQGSTWLAQSFTAPSGASTLTAVSVMLRNANESNSSAVNSSYGVEIRADNSNKPGSVLATATSSRSLGAWGQENETFTLGSPLTLTPGATYHVVVTGSSGGTIGWKCSSPAATDVTPAPSFSAMRSTDSGTTWTAVSGTCAGQVFNTVVTGTVPGSASLSNFTALTAQLGDAPQTITPPSSNAAGTFTYSSSDPNVATFSGSVITFTGIGTATITATLSPTDTANYVSTSITTTVTVVAAPTTTTTTTTSTAPTKTVPTTTTATSLAPVRTTTTMASRVTTPVVSTSTSSTTTSSTTTSSTSTSTTTTSVVDTTPAQNDGSLFGGGDVSPLRMVIDRSVGDPLDGATATVNGSGLPAGAPLTVTVFSTPRELLRSQVSSDGTFAAVVELPADLGAGRHTIVADVRDGETTITVAGVLTVDETSTITAITRPTPLTDFDGPGDSRLERAIALDRPVYDPAAHPLTTSSIVVAAASMIALAGAGGIARASSGAPSRLPTRSRSGDQEKPRRNSRGKLANAVTKKLKGLNRDGEARGDAGRTWRTPGTSWTDHFSVSAPNATGKWSAVVPRVLVDGAWLRAMFGAAGYLTWVAGAILGVVASVTDAASPLTPATGVLLVILALAVLDAGAGACAWITMTVLHLATGEALESDAIGWADLRTILGFGVLLATVPLLAHVIRPLRRQFVGNSSESWERVLDYVIMPVFLAFASGSMLKALNGLSGLEIVTTSDVTALRWTVFAAIIVRLAGEDITTVHFPRRMREVQPAKLVSPGRAPTTSGIIARSAVFVVVAEPFFGVTTVTIGAALLLAVPQVMKMWEDDLPNSASLHKWLPRGLFRFLCLLVIGAWLSSTLVSGTNDPAAIESAFIWLLMPGVIVGVVELFARFGGEWPNMAVRRSLGAVVWLAAAGIVTGQLTLFG